MKTKLVLSAIIVATIIEEATAIREASKTTKETNGKAKDARVAAAQAVFDSKRDVFGCHTEDVAKLVSGILGAEVKHGGSSRLQRLHVAVPVNNDITGHGATLEKPVISLTNDGHFLSIEPRWEKAHHIGVAETRPATDEEFAAMMEFLKANEARVWQWVKNHVGLSAVFPE